MPISKLTLSLAAEYAVASELCRRGFYTQLTLANLKRTDLLVLAEDGNVARVEVKAKQKTVWPGCKGINGEHSVLVFVDFENKQLTERPDFYILNSGDWYSFIKEKKDNSGGKMEIEEGNVPVHPPYRGTSVRVKDISKFEGKWEKVRKIIGKT